MNLASDQLSNRPIRAAWCRSRGSIFVRTFLARMLDLCGMTAPDGTRQRADVVRTAFRMAFRVPDVRPPTARPYVRPTTRQREQLTASLAADTLDDAAALVGMTVGAYRVALSRIKRRTGVSLARTIYLGVRDGWLPTVEIDG